MLHFRKKENAASVMKHLAFMCTAQVSVVRDMDDLRMIATWSTLSPWFLRVMLRLPREEKANQDRAGLDLYLVQTEGFTRGRSTRTVQPPCAKQCRLRLLWSHLSVIARLEMQTCFEERTRVLFEPLLVELVPTLSCSLFKAA